MSLKTVVEKIVADVEYPFVHAPKFVTLIDEAVKGEPAIKAAVINLVKAAELAIADGAIAVAAKGIDLPADLAEVHDIESFFTYFKGTFLPLIEAEYKELSATATAA